MASLVVDAAYVHHGTAAASADNINGWSEAALKRIKPKAFKRRLESALGLSIERACWCAARDGRVDAVAAAHGVAPMEMRARARGDAVPICLLYTSPSPRDQRGSRMPSSA